MSSNKLKKIAKSLKINSRKLPQVIMEITVYGTTNAVYGTTPNRCRRGNLYI